MQYLRSFEWGALIIIGDVLDVCLAVNSAKEYCI
jgi:hypothetical protein